MTIDLSSLPGKITVPVGARAEIRLPSYAGSGNRWSVRQVGGADAARVWVEPAGDPPVPAPPGDGTSEPPPLMLVTDRAVIVGVAPGEEAWRLVLAQPFGDST